MRADFDKWVSRNVKNYQKRNILEAKLKVAAPGPDLKLTQAENNKDVPECNCGVDASHFVAINIKFENSGPHVIGRKGEEASQEAKLVSTIAVSRDLKTLSMITKAFITSTTALFKNCYLNSTTRKVASITAQKRTNSSLESGFSFKNCTVIGSGQVYLGRAWGDYSRVVFSYTFMDNIVLAKGWSDWGDQKRDSRVYYGEYKCSGPGANLAGRVPWTRVLTDEEAKPFIEMQFIEGDTWLISP
ncbi:hypothetical protein JHK84_026818 [Glycine max]|nr:hypothetical protein JHK85_027199 [Glycine max]KAG5002566.1 hypothetical protein JHK86_026705 [Glycine max]KAG5150346.1 hypothetical protein JHK84_026818 [Glycine max]